MPKSAPTSRPENSPLPPPTATLKPRSYNAAGSIVNVGAFLLDPVKLLNKIQDDPHPVTRFSMGRGKGLFVIYEPEHLEHILVKKQGNYIKSSPYTSLKALFGNGLLFNEGKSHRSQRRMLHPVFQPRYFQQFSTGVVGTVTSSINGWKGHSVGTRVDIEDEMSALARRIIGFTVFGNDVPCDIAELLDDKFSKLGMLLGSVPVAPQHRHLKETMNKLDTVIYEAIRVRREKLKDPNYVQPNDLMNALLIARNAETGEGMDDDQMRDEVVTLLVSGFDTTARTLTWFFHSLGDNPEVEAKFRAEVQNVIGDRTATYEDVEHLTYTKMVIRETMRLFPPNPLIGREALGDDDMCGYHISKGSIISLSPYLAHRNPKYWDQPEVFNPERFTAENEALRPKLAYFPFGGGARQCIGQGMAMMTLPLAVATISQHHAFRAAMEKPLELDIKVTLRSRHPQLMTMHPAL